ncbi:MAG: DUF4936 family protein [Burkholderiaceae bacterium]|nr:DUF4936 family protein [Burkholderiaceae bacterium]
MDCYIYYKSLVSNSAQICVEIGKIDALLRQQLLPTPKLQQFKEAKKQEITWMEIYANIDNDFIGQLNNVVNQTSLLNIITSDRHVELFENVDIRLQTSA